MNDNQKYKKVTEAIIKKGKEILPPGSEITLFGSRARGEAKTDSDWDILILIPGPEQISFTATSSYAAEFMILGYEIDEFIEPIVHSFAGWEKRNFLPLYKNIQKEGIRL